ncbi:MAG: formate dehydrogenase subunit alpha [Methanocellales archaeon]|nr:formate dehydrogenase subunit alpha [Methanocellales archaeon]
MAAKTKSILSELKISRRTFAKLTALGAAATLGGYATSKKFTGKLFEKVAAQPTPELYSSTKRVKSICSFCSVGCGYIGVVEDGVFTKMDAWETHPINLGGMCSKGASMANVTNSPRRLKYPMEKVGGKWKRISWEEALDKVSNQLSSIRNSYGPDSVFFCGLVHGSNEEAYMLRKFAMLFGTNNVDHQARICHSTTVAGLLSTFGHGAMTSTVIALQHAKCHFFFGSNAAEAHPVMMQKILDAKDRGAKIVVADPRLTRTAAKADLFVRFRPGSDIAFIYGLINIILENGWQDQEFIDNRTYGFEYVKEAVKDYTPEVVERITGTPAGQLREVARMISENRPSNVIWSMGVTQHSVGSQIVRACAILSCILGNQGQWGGGCIPARGHDNVQGVTDMCVLSHFLPGYYGVTAESSWKWYAQCFSDTPSTSGKITFDELKARFDTYNGESMMTKIGFAVSRWYEGVLKPEAEIDQPRNIKAAVFWGEATSSVTEMKKEKDAMEKLDLIVIVDPFPTSASAMPNRSDGIILLPAATRQEGTGSVTTTGREWQWRDAVISPMYESRSDMWIMQQLADRLGFGEHYDYKSIEDVTREINLACRPIGLQGQTPERMKLQKEYDYTFDPWDGRAKGGPCDGQYWGLPWPCWTTDHPGTPVLYCDKAPVTEGGHDFRARWTYPADEPNAGENIVRGNLPPASTGGSIHWTYAYGTDATGEVNRQALAEGNPPTGRGRAMLRVAGWTDQVPRHREPIESPDPALVAMYPTYEDKKMYRVLTEFKTEQQRSVAEKRHEKYPFVLTTGRQVEHHGGGAQTRNADYLAEIQPEMYVEINPTVANYIGAKHWDYVWVESARGRCRVRANVTKRVDERTLFMPYHWAGVFEGVDYGDRYPEGTEELARGDSCNIITSPGYDEQTQMQETKVALCNVYKA